MNEHLIHESLFTIHGLIIYSDEIPACIHRRKYPLINVSSALTFPISKPTSIIIYKIVMQIVAIYFNTYIASYYVVMFQCVIEAINLTYNTIYLYRIIAYFGVIWIIKPSSAR